MTALVHAPGRLLLILPPLAFVALFFVWPLAGLLPQAVEDRAVYRVLTGTQEALGRWDGISRPPAKLQQALVDDLRAASDDRAIGDMTARLNSEQAGFRTLVSKTVRQLREDPEGQDLIAIDSRWGDVRYWHAIRRAMGPYTDRNLLAAFDLKRDHNGAIKRIATGESSNLNGLVRTLWISLVVTLCCVLIGYPYALLTASSAGWRRNLLLIAVIVPVWTSLLVRTAAWMIVLPDSGLINAALLRLGLIEVPLPLMFNRAGTIVAMTHVLLPLMVLPVYSVLLAIPRNLNNAAASLGASPLRVFRTVILPLSARGLAAGSLLVFMSSIGYYITPALIGGPNDQMISATIALYASQLGNWGMASALGLVILSITIVLYVAYDRISLKTEEQA